MSIVMCYWYYEFRSLSLICLRGRLEIIKHKHTFLQVYNRGPVALRYIYVSTNLDVFANLNDDYELFESIVVDNKSRYPAPKSAGYEVLTSAFSMDRRWYYACYQSNMNFSEKSVPYKRNGPYITASKSFFVSNSSDENNQGGQMSTIKVVLSKKKNRKIIQ